MGIAAIVNADIVAVAAHYYNRMVVVQAPVYLQEVVQAAVAQSHRFISGIAGPTAQVADAKKILGLANRPTYLDFVGI